MEEIPHNSGRPKGCCSVETKSLDGETNLKERSVPTYFRSSLRGTPEEPVGNFRSCKGFIECEVPNATTQKFVGTLHPEGGQASGLSITNVLLRGCTLRNAEYAIGLVVNTGVDTKVMQGARKPKEPLSSIDRTMNLLILAVCSLLVIMCLAGAIAQTNFTNSIRHKAWYLNFGNDSTSFFWIIVQYFVLLSSFVSVTIYVSSYSCKSIQSWFMQQSVAMYDEESDTPMKCRTIFLTDELGRVSHVFSDKTGTLTQNMMQFRKCSINGTSYGKGHTEIGLARLARLGQARGAGTGEGHIVAVRPARVGRPCGAECGRQHKVGPAPYCAAPD